MWNPFFDSCRQKKVPFFKFHFWGDDKSKNSWNTDRFQTKESTDFTSIPMMHFNNKKRQILNPSSKIEKKKYHVRKWGCLHIMHNKQSRHQNKRRTNNKKKSDDRRRTCQTTNFKRDERKKKKKSIPSIKKNKKKKKRIVIHPELFVCCVYIYILL